MNKYLIIALMLYSPVEAAPKPFIHAKIVGQYRLDMGDGIGARIRLNQDGTYTMTYLLDHGSTEKGRWAVNGEFLVLFNSKETFSINVNKMKRWFQLKLEQE